jgi:chaperone modulatory protein CbpM
MIRRTTVVTGVVLDESIDFSLGELCRSCGVDTEFIVAMIDEGLIEPRGMEPDDWRFRGPELLRVQSAVRLTQDLRLNLAGAALALELMDELDALRRQLRQRHERPPEPPRLR